MSGLFGIASLEKDGKAESCMGDLFYGTDYQSHMGSAFAGLAIQHDGELHREIHQMPHGQFKNLFDRFHQTHGSHGQFGVGVISGLDPQPIILESRLGTFTLVTTGLMCNGTDLANDLMSKGTTFSEVREGRVNQTELAAKLIVRRDSIVAGIEYLFSRIKGAISLILMTREGLYAACDPGGRFPLTLGQNAHAIAIASETCAFPNLGYRVDRSIQPGEIAFLKGQGITSPKSADRSKKVCSFLWIYTAYPASVYENISVEIARERCGQALARKDWVKADLVAGVPDSGTGHAVGYAMESKLPFRRPLVKYSPGYGRSYTPPSQEVRDHVAKMKLIPIDDVIRGNRLIVCEDSIVRGTQLKNQTIMKLRERDAKEIHIRVACPPLMFPCRYNFSTRKEEELAARKALKAMGKEGLSDVTEYLDPSSPGHREMVDTIRRDLECDSLVYLTLEEMIQAIGMRADGLCTTCWNGQ